VFVLDKTADWRAFYCNQVLKQLKEQARSTAWVPVAFQTSGGQQNKEKISGSKTHANFDLGMKIFSDQTSESCNPRLHQASVIIFRHSFGGDDAAEIFIFYRDTSTFVITFRANLIFPAQPSTLNTSA
jgi:hypothetical protein